MIHRVSAGRRIDHQKYFMRCRGVELAECAFHLFQFSHQICFRVLTTSSVAEQKLHLAIGRALVRFITKCGRICTVLTANDFDSNPFGPNVELLDRSCAKSVGGSQDDTFALLLQIMRQFRCRRRLARSVYAYD